ncbi:gluconate 5-dehydrogenase [Algivirga pacifica]|uniref:Gluconate 5-dehydrogenase n=1 Tax=Algivirga pacifica TaxID=1162670 RepID=A0ABP9D7Y6_9BACT
MILDRFRLDGKNALITGGTHGLGMAIAKGLGEAGATLIINDVFEDKLQAALEEYKTAGLEAYGYHFDVTDEDSVKEALERIDKERGGVDILVNNAGIIDRTPALNLSVDTFRKVLDIDLVGPFVMSKYVGAHMKEKGGGKIINMCSMMSELGRNSVSAYAAAKGGLKMLTRNLATEWAKYNINVNGIGPGYFATTQTAPIREEGHPFNEFILNRTPAARWGDPQDLQGAAVFLASAASDFVNGHIVYVDGGILATIGKPHGEE